MDFRGFTPDSFEQFIRALALKIIGPGVTVFGNGPDGGREATFQGKVNYPYPPNNIWDGYGVIQAKFKEKTESTKKDQTWAIKQLNDELALWIKSTKRSPKPKYFIFCTNVELSSAANGGRTEIEKVFENKKQLLGLDAYAIWDANQLTGFVDGLEEIRKRFSCFFTTGDLLSAFAKKLSFGGDADAIFNAYLCREILADEDARLSQAGDRSEDRIRLANVFTDLPVVSNPSSNMPDEDASDELHSVSLHELLHIGGYKLDPLALYEQGKLQEGKELTKRLFNRFVYLGGPGSGKSTIGQFLAQIHRGALLERRPTHRLEQKVKNVISELKSRCAEDGLSWPKTPRYPFRIELNAFAKALAAGQNDGVMTLSEYLQKKVSHDYSLKHEDIRDWLRLFPWLLILDGLDEVPSSSNRREVVAAIQNFLSEARDLEADLMVVASSRPDGYAGEFDGDEVAQRYLLPLSKSRALACAQRYVNAKVASKGDQRATESMAILKSAIENPLVARLMRSPLQVTFMVTVVAASGKPSESRWQLFNEYYRTIYERELHKAVPPFDKALNERRQDIDALHHRVGFILQCRAESSGGTQADLSMSEFEQVVIECLEENGLPESELSKQKEMILGAANQRLVFLTSRTPGRLSFDVRSLQEYMAAACITNADSSVIISRLETIAHAAYWRNTFLFAVGRFFVDSQIRDHRDKIRLLCDDLNRKDGDRAIAKLGSHLALEILESGTIGNVPMVSRSLAACALELLIKPAGVDEIPKRLSEIYEPTMESEFKTALSLWIGQKESTLAITAWMLILYLEKNGVTWAVDIAKEKWINNKSSLETFSSWLLILENSVQQVLKLNLPNAKRLKKLIPYVSLKEFNNDLLATEITLDEETDSTWMEPLISWWQEKSELDIDLFINKKQTAIQLRCNLLPLPKQVEKFQKIKSLYAEKNIHPDWKTLEIIGDFYIDPNAYTLSKVLKSMANSDPEDWAHWSRKLSWPIASCLKSATSKEELFELSNKFEQGEFRDISEWVIQENEWASTGIELTELCDNLFQAGSSLGGVIHGISVSSGIETQSAEQVTKELFDCLLNQYEEKEVKKVLAWILTFYAACTGTLHSLEPNLLTNHLLPTRKTWHSHDVLLDREKIESNTADWINFFDSFGRMENLKFVSFSWRINEFPLEFLREEYVKDTSKYGLLRLLGFWCASGRRVEEKLTALTSLKTIENDKFRLAAICVRMTQQNISIDNAKQIADCIPSVISETGEQEAMHILLSTIEHQAQKNPELEVVLLELIKHISEEKWQLRARAEMLRIKFLQARYSGFHGDTLKSLGLPAIKY